MWVSVAWFESNEPHDEHVRGIAKRFGNREHWPDGARRVQVTQNRDDYGMLMVYFDSVQEMDAHQGAFGETPEKLLPPNTRLKGVDGRQVLFDATA